MPQTFVFTASNPEAQRNLVISIENPIDEETVFGSFASTAREELERIREDGNGFYTWGAVPGLKNIPNWETMERGDYVLCVYNSTYYYVARVTWPSMTMRGSQVASGARTKMARRGSICTS